jgi:putative ABC transport system substrate-binding protein
VIARRAFLATVAVGVATTRARAQAQGPRKVARIGYVGGAVGNAEIFLKALQELGYVHGQTVHVDVVAVEAGQGHRYPELAAKFVAQGVDVIVASNPYALEAAIKATPTIPIVGMDLESDPVAKGWVTSLSRPGGNVTGVFLDIPEMSGKQVQFLDRVIE